MYRSVKQNATTHMAFCQECNHITEYGPHTWRHAGGGCVHLFSTER